MDQLRSPQFIVPRIRGTNFHRSEETAKLSDLFGYVLGTSSGGTSRVPLGKCQDIIYSISPCDSLPQISIKIYHYKNLGPEIASSSFFCIERCSVNEASRSPWGGCPPLEPSRYAGDRPRKVLGKSDNSTDSGYASGGEAERPTSPESQKVEELEMDYDELTGSCFYTLGNLEWQLGTGGCAKTSDYIVAVSLYDSSI